MRSKYASSNDFGSEILPSVLTEYQVQVEVGIHTLLAKSPKFEFLDLKNPFFKSLRNHTAWRIGRNHWAIAAWTADRESYIRTRGSMQDWESSVLESRELCFHALLTDGRFSGGSHGFVVGHICPEAQEGGPIGLIQTGDQITIDVAKRRIDVNLTEEQLEERRKRWTPPSYKANRGVLYKYIKNVQPASQGCVTDVMKEII
ncbi:putative dihydroxy-acid dehydratase [Carex littledalei]|uniref:Putative dihydroxy-acid dehydratase n=1 Tax=Carex littledalei TaxID=544730 RepID=A0A833QL85_9POAL|nr:putative dihydroxy-acid dehydratase [Carex littledalei]